MANCPNCGSNHIQLKQDANVNWGRAVAGWALFGVLGGAVGAVTGESKNINVCLDCGTAWDATDLHKILQNIQEITGRNLALENESDRQYMNEFVSELNSDLEKLGSLEKETEKRIERVKEEESSIGSGIGCLVGIILGVFAWVTIGFGAFLTVSIIISCIGYFYDELTKNSTGTKKKIENRVQEEKRLIEAEKMEIEQEIKSKVNKLENKYTDNL